MKIFFTFWLAFVLVYLIVPLVIRLCLKFGFLDKPSRRKVHTKAMPRLGGLAVILAFCLSLWFIFKIDAGFRTAFSARVAGLAASVFLLILLGLWDDIFGTNAKVKLLFQIFIGLILFYSGLRVGVFTNPVSGGEASLSFPVSLFLTTLWIVVMMNAINLIDGLDGLASGIVFISSFCLIGVGLYLKTQIPVVLLSILCGSTLGFLLYNFPPAKIFLGDIGSMFLGLILAFASLIDLQYKAATAAALLIPLCALALPLSDIFLAIGRRMAKKGSIFIADKKHLHHRLLQLGLSQKQVVVAFYLATLYLGIISFLFVLIPNSYALLLLVLLSIGLFFAIRVLGFIERKIREHA